MKLTQFRLIHWIEDLIGKRVRGGGGGGEREFKKYLIRVEQRIM